MDSYSVRYWFLKEDGYWEQKEDIIKIKGKNKHNKVKKEWLLKHSNHVVNLIGICYI